MAVDLLASPCCRICGQPITGGLLYLCPECSTPHHADCWKYAGGCAVFGCTRSSAHAERSLVPAPEGYTVAQKILLASLWIPGWFFFVLGMSFLMAASVPLAILFLIGSVVLFRKGWQDAIRPFVRGVPWLGAVMCFLLGTGCVGSALLGITILSMAPDAPLMIGLFGAIAAILGRESHALFHDLRDEAEVLEGLPEDPIMIEKQRMAREDEISRGR